MKMIIAGGRDFTDKDKIEEAVRHLIQSKVLTRDFELVCGMARGADITAYHLCKSKGNIIHEYPADWGSYGKSAGHRRNRDMGNNADMLLAFWDGTSKGTKGMIDYMRSLNKPVYVISY